MGVSTQLIRAAALLLPLLAMQSVSSAWADAPSDRLRHVARGVNITNWFRYPARQDDAALRDYVSDDALRQLRAAGFTFVRLAVQPELMLDRRGEPDAHRLGLLIQAIGRIERQGLAVMVGWHPQTWDLPNSPAQQRKLLDLWGALAARLRPLDTAMTFPEVLNEPVFDGAAPRWEALQSDLLARIRRELPHAMVVLTGPHWGSVEGLLALHPVADRDVVYSFHSYDPATFTSFAQFEPGLDRDALRHLPFPVDDTRACEHVAERTEHQRTADVIRFYCSERWDAARVSGVVQQAAEWARRNGVAVLCGEFGASNEIAAPARLAWLTAMRRALEANGIGWAVWGYDDSMGFGARPGSQPTPALDPATLHALGL